MPEELSNLEQLLDRIAEAASGREKVSMDVIVTGVGRRSFGPLLLLPGVLLISPLSGIPGMATLMGLFVASIAVQLVIGRRHFWLPAWLLRRSVSRAKLEWAIGRMRPAARFIDQGLKPRLTLAVSGPAIYGIAFVCLLIAALMPMMELVPFSATGAGLALSAFGLSLTARDGVLAAMAFLATAATSGLMISSLV